MYVLTGSFGVFELVFDRGRRDDRVVRSHRAQRRRGANPFGRVSGRALRGRRRTSRRWRSASPRQSHGLAL